MEKVLIKNVRVIGEQSPWNNKRVDLWLENGQLSEYDGKATPQRIVQSGNLQMSTGLFDLRANFRQPGYEYKETIESGARAARAGGFTGVQLMPTLNPVTDKPAQALYLQRQSQAAGIEILSAGALSKGCAGKELSEMYDLYQSGVRVFTDDKNPVDESGLLIRALQYASVFGGRIWHFPFDRHLVKNGQIHEGSVSTQTGLRGIPSLSEAMVVSRDLALAQYSGAPIHLGPISSAAAVALIREAKDGGQNVTAEVCAHQLLFTDTALLEFDSAYKVMPPFRSEHDRQALIDGICDGTIDVITSDHTPEDEESKNLEFDLSAFGASTIQWAFPMALTALKDKMSLEAIIRQLTVIPRTMLGLETEVPRPGVPAHFVLFDPDEPTASKPSENWFSASPYTPTPPEGLTGRVLASAWQGDVRLYIG